MALAATVSVAQVGGPARTEQEAETRRKLEAVRAQLRTLADEQRATRGERSEAERQLRERELAIARIAGELQDLDARVASEQRELDGLEARRKEFEQALRAQRDALAALLRSAYALGRDQELKLLLQQDDVAGIARVLAYHRYFQRSRIERIDRVRADLAHLADVEAAIATTTAALDEVRAARRTEVQRLEAERTRHEALVAEIDARLGDQRARILALGRDEAELAALLERLRDVFADIPPALDGDRPFQSLRGSLPWPLRGRVLTAFGQKDAADRTSSGILLAAKAGTPVRAVANGRVAFADWLRGYGLMLIVDHGDGYLSLYGGNESLLKDVGDWIEAGETIATSGASGGQGAPGLYFEIRAKGKPVDPRRWLARVR